MKKTKNIGLRPQFPAPSFSIRENRRVMISVFLSLVMSFYLIPVPNATAGKGPYPELAAQLAKEAEAILVKRGACASFKECNIQERVRMSGGPNKATLYIYEAHKISDETISDLILLCLKAYKENQQDVDIGLKLYRVTDREKMHQGRLFGLFGIKPFMEMKLERGNGPWQR